MDLQLLVALLGVEADGLDGGDHNHHTERDGDEEHDHVLGSVLQRQLLFIHVYLLVRTRAVRWPRPSLCRHLGGGSQAVKTVGWMKTSPSAEGYLLGGLGSGRAQVRAGPVGRHHRVR